MLCRTLTVLYPRLRGHQFNRDSARTHSILCLCTATVVEAGMEISCPTTHSPWPTPNSSGTNVFAQPIPSEHNVYVFSPLVLVGPFLRYFLDQRQRFAFTIIVPRFHPRRYWWAILQALADDSFVLGRKGDPSVPQFPFRSSPVFTARPLPWDLWAFRCICPA